MIVEMVLVPIMFELPLARVYITLSKHHFTKDPGAAALREHWTRNWLYKCYKRPGGNIQ